MDKLETNELVAVTVIGVVVVETLKMYRETAPDLTQLRSSVPGDFVSRQMLLDADMLGLVAVLAIGGGGAMMVKRWSPLLLAGAGLLLISAFYRSVLRSDKVEVC